MRLLMLSALFGMTFLGVVVSASASAPNVYIAQNAAGANNGQDCANARAVSFFNSPSNWGAGATQIGPGTTAHLCGTITDGLQINGSGTNGNVTKILWETGARISVAFGQIISLNGGNGYLQFDGGVPCGPGTACDTVEAANMTGYAAGQSGIIEATANGSLLANKTTSAAFWGCNGCHDIEIRNLIMRNLYIHSTMSDSIDSGDTGNYIFQCPYGGAGCLGTISIHDSTVHDTGNAISFQRGNSTTINVYNIDFYRNNWAMEHSGAGTRTLNFYGNHCHDTANWDTTSDAFHHNCLHQYMETGSDSLALNIYNNLADGNWGSCCTTATLMYFELATPNNANVFNNVSVQYPGNTAPAILYGGANGIVANNTTIGVATTPSNVNAIAIGGKNVTFKNNAMENYGQYLVANDSGMTSYSIDNNQYGPLGQSGNCQWSWMGTGKCDIQAWRTVCSCDLHGSVQTTFNVTAAGIPLPGSQLIATGANLTSVCSGQPNPGLGALCFDAAGRARPASGAWDAGAYQYSGSTLPSPPILLTTTVK